MLITAVGQTALSDPVNPAHAWIKGHGKGTTARQLTIEFDLNVDSTGKVSGTRVDDSFDRNEMRIQGKILSEIRAKLVAYGGGEDFEYMVRLKFENSLLVTTRGGMGYSFYMEKVK